MATIGNYYLNGPDLVTSTGIFTDAAFTTCAPDGWYSQGGIVRELDNCILLPRAQCPSCANPCGASLSVDGLADYGLYLIPVELGTAQGAVKVTFNPKLKVQGIRAIYNDAVFNKFSSEQDGYHGTTVTNGLTYMGDATYDPTIPLTILTAEFDYYDGAFTNNGTVVNILVTQLSTTTGKSPEECIAYIPKPLSGPSTVDVEVAQVINGQATPSWTVRVECPALLLGLDCTEVNPLGDCDTLLPLDETIFLGKVSGSIYSPVVHDWAFEDAYAVTKKVGGDYVVQDTTPAKWLVTVGVNGIITTVTECT